MDTIEIINNVPYVVTGGRKVKYADILRYNNPGTDYDDVTLEEIPSAPTTPPAYSPGDVKKREPKPFGQFTRDTASEAWDATKSIANAGGAVTNGLLQEYTGHQVPGPVAAAGDYGLAGLNGLLGLLATGIAGGSEAINAGVINGVEALGGKFPYDRDTANQKLAGDLMGMVDMLPQMAEGYMMGRMAAEAKPYLMAKAKGFR